MVSGLFWLCFSGELRLYDEFRLHTLGGETVVERESQVRVAVDLINCFKTVLMVC